MNALMSFLSMISLGLFGMTYTSPISHWVMVEPSNDYYIDQGSIERQGDEVHYAGRYMSLPDYATQWVKEEAPNQQPAFLVDRNVIDCKEKAIKFVSDTVYNGQGKAIASVDYSSSWKPILPDSSAESEWAFVCFQPPLPYSIVRGDE